MHRLTATYLPLMLASLTLPANHSCACTRMSFNAYLLSRTDSVESLISQSKNKENRAILPSGSVEIAIDTTRLLHTAQLKAVKMASPSSSEANAPSTGNNHCWKTQLLAKGKYVIDTMAQHLKAPTVTSPAVLDVHMEPDYMEQEPSSLPQSGNLHAFFQHAPEDAIWMQQETERSIPQATLISKTITLTLPNGEALQRSYTPGLHDGQPPARSRATPTPAPAPAPFILIHPALQQGGSRLLATELNIKANPKGVTETDTLEKQAAVIGLPSLFTHSQENQNSDFFTQCWLPELLRISSNTAAKCSLSFNNHRRPPTTPEAKKNLTVQLPRQDDTITFASTDNKTWIYITWETRYGTKLLLEQLEQYAPPLFDANPCSTTGRDTMIDALSEAMEENL